MSIETEYGTIIHPAVPAARTHRQHGAGLFGTVLQPLTGLILPAAGLLVWQIGSATGLVPIQILPEPGFVLDTARQLIADGELGHHTAVSLTRVAAGFTLGGLAGLVLGALMGLSEGLRRLVEPLFLAIAQVPALGWLPLLMLVVGIGEPMTMIVIAKAAMVPVALNTLDGIRAVPAGFLDLGRVLGFGPLRSLARVVLPASVPAVFTGIRSGLGHAWAALVAVELLASSEGLGYLMVWGRQLFQLDMVLVAMAVVGLIGLVLDRMLGLIQRRLDRWKIGTGS